MKKAAKRVSPRKKAAATKAKKRRPAARKAVTTRTRRPARKKAAPTKQRDETVQLAEAALAGFDAGDLTMVRIKLKHLVDLLTERHGR